MINISLNQLSLKLYPKGLKTDKWVCSLSWMSFDDVLSCIICDISMSRWGNANQNDESVDYKHLLAQHPQALSLLSANPKLSQQVKCNSTPFTQLIVQPQHRTTLIQLLTLAIAPEQFSAPVTREHTHQAIQILSALSEEFIEHVFENEHKEEDQVVQQEDKQYPLLTEMFQLAKGQETQNQSQETGLAYFAKLVTPFVYQRPAEMLHFITNQALKNVVALFHSPSISDLIAKLLEAENEDSFFEKQKITLLCSISSELALVLPTSPTKEEVIQNYGQLLQALVQKHEDKYEKSKYAKMIREIMEESHEVFGFLLQMLQQEEQKDKQGSNTLKSQALKCIQKVLRIHEQVKPGSKVHEQDSSGIEAIQLNSSFKQKLKSYLTDYFQPQLQSTYPLHLLNLFKTLKTFLFLCPQLASSILSAPLVKEILNLLPSQPNNNILHNLIRDIIVNAIKNNQETLQLMNEIGLENIIKKEDISEKNSKKSYQSQIFIIGETLQEQWKKNKSEGGSIADKQMNIQWSELEEPFKNKRAFYSVLIGPDPRNTSEKWGSFEQELILKPLKQTPKREQAKLESQPTATKARNQSYAMVSRIQDLQGTQVLSQDEGEEVFGNEKSRLKNNHYFDDVGMTDLPLDSDRDEDDNSRNLMGSASLDDIPADLRQNSGIMLRVDDLPDSLNQNSREQLPPASLQNSNSLTLPSSAPIGRQNSIVAIDLQGISPTYLIQPKTTIQQLRKNSFSKSNKGESSLIEDEVSELTVSINIEDGEKVEFGKQEAQKRGQKCREEGSTLLEARYGLIPTSFEANPVAEEIMMLLLSKYYLTL